MKKIVTFIAFFFLILHVYAQKIDFGLKGGLNISTLNFSDNSSINSKAGLHLGVFFRVHASPKWALQPEFIYSMEGAREPLTGSDNKTIYRLNYLNVPVLLQRIFHNGFRIEGGPQIGFLLNSRIKSGNGAVNNPDFIASSFSIPLGVSYLIPTGIGFDARYVFGLSNINNQNRAVIIQSNVFQLGIIYMVGYPQRK
jgi:hypothetical protein